MNRKKALMAGAALASISMLTFSLLVSFPHLDFADGAGYDCAYFYDTNNGFKSIADLVSDLNGGTSNFTAKTWGTVTETYSDKTNGYYHFFIQSTNASGKAAGILVNTASSTNIATTGNLVSVSGTVSISYGKPQIALSTISIISQANPYPVSVLETTSSFWVGSNDKTSAQYQSIQAMGGRQVSFSGATISYSSGSSATATFSDGTSLTMFVPTGMATTTQNAVQSALSSANGSSAYTVTGILTAFSNGSTNVIELLLHNTSNLVANGETTLTFNSTTASGISSQYSTGNYGTATINGFACDYYRCIKDGTNFVKMLAQSYSGSLAPSIANTDAIKQMTHISISYRMDGTSGSGAKLYYGSSNQLTNYLSLPYSSTSTTESFTFSSADAISFWRIDGDTSQTTYVSSMSVTSSNGGTAPTTSYASSGTGHYRINPVRYSGTLETGATVNVPMSITVTGTTYSVDTYKTYTYYRYADVDGSNASSAALTDPIDVANYFVAFGTYPANYVFSGSYSAAYAIFGSNTRQVSQYNLSTGYATAIPVRLNSGSTATYDYYYECDIDLTGSYAASSSSPTRGVGRVIVFTGGFDASRGATGYTYDPVAIFSDDHYATFQECYNNGSWSERFNAERLRTNYQYGAPTTVTLA